MRELELRAEAGLAVAAAVEDALEPGEHAATFLDRTARRRLVVDAAGRKRLYIEDGTFGGFVRLGRGGRELYLNAHELAAAGAPALLATGRPLFPAGSPLPARERAELHTPVNADGEGWESTDSRLDLAAAAPETARLTEAVATGLRPGQTVQGLQLADVLGESVHSTSGGRRRWSRCYGVELTAVAADERSGRIASVTRYAQDLAKLDPAGLGTELALTAAGMGTPSGDERELLGNEVVFTPGAAAQLLRAIVSTVLLNPVTRALPLRTALIDDGLAAGYGAKAFDCEGTPTGRTELITAAGVQRAVATRKAAVGGDGAEPKLTGHAWWNPLKNFPQLAANNVHLAPTTAGGALLAGERLVVVDARTLGVEEFRSGGQLAFRLLAVRAVDGVPQEPLRPMTVEGEAIDLLAALTEVGETVSYFPGVFSVGGAYLAMNLSRLTSRSRGTDELS
ncbi:hypothetical protein GCM10018790_40960 [Kitasatospora xanthocidica]|uniref:metallopeptidase TldD-related protein n=1 Tax=Kitasatospora xanthocidica TaxID=83382 RepID=UPI001674FFF4|nr:metallopeptidase TldD-related protein [Kitasatospora xanthocidica]GHF58846.1 hypothetical protein GCM10018790_40960 [Kitasatospora xanthocidica]